MAKVIIRTDQEIADMREGGKVLAQCLKETAALAKPGVSTLELDQFAEKFLRAHGGTPSFKGYHGFPGTLCTNVNEVVVHGIPRSDEILQEGDLIAIDCGFFYKGLHTDSTILLALDPISPEKQKIIKAAEETLSKAIDFIRPGIRVGDLSKVIEQTIRHHGYSPVEELTGHGVGRSLHEKPHIPNHYDGDGPIIQAGQTLAIEPIFATVSPQIHTLKDKWTIVTQDKSLSAQIEHTILVTETGCENLTERD
jgi:methionyl aminopeptidase